MQEKQIQKQEESRSIISSHKHEHKMLDNVSEDIQRYLDMQVIDPDWQFAAKHAKSCRPGLVNPAVNEKEKCICCMRLVNKDPVSLCSNTKSLQFLGYGFPLYFIFLKYLMMLIFLLIVTYTGIELSWAVQQNHDFYFNNQTLFREGHNITCSSYMVYLSRLNSTVDNSQRVVRFLSFFTLMLALLYMRDKIRKTNEYYDERSTNYSDFSLLVQNLPNKTDIENDPSLKGKTIGEIVKGFLTDSRIFQEKVVQVKTIFIGEYSRMDQLYQKRKQKAEQLGNIEEKYKKIKEKQFKAKQTGQTLNEKQIEQIQRLKGIRRNLFKEMDENSQLSKEEKFKLLTEMKNGSIDGDKIILCYKEQNERQYIEEAINHCPIELLIHHFGQKGNHLKAAQAPQPQQIIWQNINLSSSEQYKRLILSWVAFVLILVALSISFYFLLKLKSHEIQIQIDLLNNDPAEAHFLYSTVQTIVYCSLIFIILFNKLIFANVIHHLVEYQRHITGQAQQFAICLKYTLGLFFTTALMTLLVEGATYHNVYETDYGILEEETIMFYLSSFAVPAIWLINPWYILQWIKRKYYHGSKFLTQEQANKLMEDPEYLMGKRYGELLQIVWFTYLYSCVIPFGSILILVGIVFYYWVDKYNLLRKSSVTEGLAVKLKLKALNLLDFVLVLKPAGEMIFDRLIRHDWEVVSVVQLCLGIMYMLLPLNSILDYFLQEDFRGTSQNYFDLEKNNLFSYQLYNPLTKQQELRKHFNQIEECTDSDHDHPSAFGEPYLTVSNKLIAGKKSKKRIYEHKIGYRNTIVRPHNMNESRKLVTMPDGSIQRLQD